MVRPCQASLMHPFCQRGLARTRLCDLDGPGARTRGLDDSLGRSEGQMIPSRGRSYLMFNCILYSGVLSTFQVLGQRRSVSAGNSGDRYLESDVSSNAWRPLLRLEATASRMEFRVQESWYKNPGTVALTPPSAGRQTPQQVST